MKAADTNGGNVGGTVPLYRAIVEALRDEIKEGRYQKTFPSEAQLVRRFAVGRQTVIRAIGELVNQGLVERRRGSGRREGNCARHPRFSR